MIGKMDTPPSDQPNLDDSFSNEPEIEGQEIVSPDNITTVEFDNQEELLPNIEGSISSGVQIAPTNNINQVDAELEQDPNLFIELGDRVVINSDKYLQTIGVVYYRSGELIRVLPDGVSNILHDFPVSEVEHDNELSEEFDADVGVSDVFIIEKRKFDNFIEQHDLRVGQNVESIDNNGQIYSTFKITKVDKESDSIEVEDESGASRIIEFDGIGIPLDENFIIIRTRQEPIREPVIDKEEEETVKTLEQIEEEEVKEEEKEEEEGVDVIGFVTLAKATVYKEAPITQQRFPDNLQKVDALNDFLNMLDPSLQKDPRALKAVRILVETLFYLKQATVDYNEDGTVKGQKPVSVSTIADLIQSVNVPISRPVLDIAKKLYYSQKDVGEEEFEEPDTDEYFFQEFATELQNEINRTSRIVSSSMVGGEGEKINQFWNESASYLKNFNSPFLANNTSEPLWKALADVDIFRYEPPDMSSENVSGYVASHSEKFPPILSKLNFALERALTNTFRKGSERKKQLLTSGDMATMKSYLMFPLKAVAHLGTTRSGNLAIDSGRSHMQTKTMKMILEEIGDPKEIGTSNDLLLLDIHGNTLGNIPIKDYLEGLSIPALGLGDTFNTLQQYGFDSLELTSDIVEVLLNKIRSYQAQLITTLSKLRESLQQDVPTSPEDNSFIENVSILEGSLRQEPTLVDDLLEYERINPTLSKSDIGQIAYLLKKHSDYFQVAVGNNPLFTAKERIRATRDMFLETLQIAKLLKQKKLNAGAQPIPNKCEHVAKLVTIRKIYDDTERFQALTKFFAYYQGDREDNWINCNLCSEHLLCVHERLQIQSFLDSKERESLQKEIILNFSGGQFQGKYICRNCGQPIKDLDFDTHLEYDDDGRPMMGRAVLEDQDEINKEKIDQALGAPIYSKGEKDILLSETQKKTYEIVKEIAVRVGVDLTTESYISIINFVIEALNTLFDETKYNEVAKKSKVPMPEYKVWISRQHIYFAGCYLLLEIQTHVPSYPVRTTLIGCKDPGFGGIPLTNESKQGINYIACAIASIIRSTSPWSDTGFQKEKNVEKRIMGIATNMDAIITKKISLNSIILQKIADKKRYLLNITSEEIKAKLPKDNIPATFLPEQVIITPAEAAKNPIITEVAENMNSKAKYILSKQWIRSSHALAQKTASLIRGSKITETTCCLANIQQPNTFWQSVSNLPHIGKRQLIPNRQGSFLQVHFTPRPAENLLVKPDSEFYYRLFLKCCFQGPRIGYSHEPGLTNKCAWCGFQFPSNPAVVDTDTEGKLALTSQQVKTGEEEFVSLLDRIHQVNYVTLNNYKKVASMEETMLELANINPQPVSGWKEIINDTTKGFISLPKDADRGDLVQVLGVLSDATVEPNEIIKRKFNNEAFLNIIDEINNLQWLDWYKVVLTYFIIPLRRILTNFNPDSLFVPIELKLSSLHITDITKILENDTYIVKEKKKKILNPIVSLARHKIEFFLKQMSALLEFKDKIRPTVVPGRNNTLRYIQRVMFLGPLSTLIDPTVIPEDAGISTPLNTVNDESMKIILELIATLLLKYNKESLNYTDERIKEMIAVRNEKEKVEIINEFDKKSEEEKAVELIKKRLGMGRWAVGGTKVIYAYDPEQYDREREERERAGIISFPGLGPYDTPNLDGRQIDELGFFEFGDEAEYEHQEGGYDFTQTREDDA